jgi:signal transduction histidine kinase
VRRSLLARFALAGLAAAAILVAVTGTALQGLFERHAERAILDELRADLRFLTRGLTLVEGRAELRLDPLPDPRFLEPFSGLYWQVSDDASGQVMRSPSLAGFTLPLPDDNLSSGKLHRHILFGPEGTKLIVLERRISNGAAEKAGLRFAVAVDRRIVDAANRAFLADFLPVLGILAGGFLLAALAQAGIAFRPVAEARAAVAAIRAGRRERLGRGLPAELQGLATEFDALLDAQRQATRLVRERADDLAHGLRTPLAILQARARDLAERGEGEIAREIEAIAAALEARIGRELARAQILGPGARSGAVPLAPIVARLTAAFARGPAGERLAWPLDVPESLVVAMAEEDLLELLGSLLDNATKWARGEVRVSAAEAEGAVRIVIADDGPGIPAGERRNALTRGTRLDPARSGSGLGLAIAHDIATAYGGALELAEAASGGLAVRLRVPGGAAPAGRG